MKYTVKNSVVIFLILTITSVSYLAANERQGLPDYSQTYDPERDPFNDLVLATNKAEENHRLILLIVGGYWCSWCHTLDKYLEDNEEFADLFHTTFEVVKIHYGSENKNEFFLSKFPVIKAYPHFFIMDSNFGVLAAQSTDSLEKQKRFPLSSGHYQDKRMNEFLDKWTKYLQNSIGQDQAPFGEKSEIETQP